MRFLLDTCVLSETWKARPDPGVLAWLQAHDDYCAISQMSLGEIRKGIAKKEALTGQRQTTLNDWLDNLASEKQADTLPLDADVISLWGEIAGQSEARGIPLPVIDSLIAATAITHNLAVVTRNTGDFERCGVKTINPWAA